MNRTIKNIFAMTMGTALVAVAYAVFFIPCNIAPGGLGGVAVTLSKYIPIGTGILTAILNVPVMIAALFVLGKKFTLSTVALLAIMTVGMDSVKMDIGIDDRFLASVVGGMLTGVGLGLVMYAGASTGGTDTIAVILNKKNPNMKTSGLLLILDAAVVLFSAVVYGLVTAIYSAVAIMMQMVFIDYVFDGIRANVAVYIVTSSPAEVKQRLYDRVGRGVTDICIKGGFSGKEGVMLMCIAPKRQLSEIKSVVYSIDKKAFLFNTPTGGVNGEGFDPFV